MLAKLNPYHRRGLIALLFITSGLIFLSWLGIYFGVDLKISTRCFSPENEWYLGSFQPWLFLYHYGTLPGLGLTITMLIILFLSLSDIRFRNYRRYALLVILTAIIGGGIVVNGILKPYWGRPRPYQVEAFGGEWQYRDIHQLGIPGKGHSFPCGHCTMGFLFTTLFFFRRVAPKTALWGGTAGVIYGSLLGAARIVQGGHFALDVLWGFGVIILTATVLYYFVLGIPQLKDEKLQTPSRRNQRFLAGGIVVLCLIITGAFLSRRPFYETYRHRNYLAPSIQNINIYLNTVHESSTIRYVNQNENKIMVILNVHGFGWSNVKHHFTKDKQEHGDTLDLRYHLTAEGYFSEQYLNVEIKVPTFLKDKLNFKIIDEQSQNEKK